MVKLSLDLTEKGGCIEVLIQQAQRNGSMNFKELLECINSYGITEREQIDPMLLMIEDLGIQIINKNV